ncbi:MAG: hypothetical protein L3J70_10530 [Gammaproteobacteria bacterium]|nr:hypothetical protein [Gammaproteobacteria bacterium]
MKNSHLVVYALSTIFVSPAFAGGDIDQLEKLTSQDEFLSLSKDLGAAFSYKSIVPAEPMGILGFDVGVEVTATQMEHSDIWKKAASSNGSSSVLYLPKLHAHKGLPFGFDIGASYSALPSTDISMMGAEVRYAILEGSIATPALAVRGTYSRINGIDELDFETKGLELSLSKGFAILTPYGGVGKVWVNSDPGGVAKSVAGLESESFAENKLFAGISMNLLILNLTVEADKIGDNTSYSAKVSLGF